MPERLWGKRFMKKVLKYIILLLLVCCCTYLVYKHRRVIRAWLKGEKMHEAPDGHCHSFCKKWNGGQTE